VPGDWYYCPEFATLLEGESTELTVSREPQAYFVWLFLGSVTADFNQF